jgi:ribosomal protein S18 acetylase RimI-like enzyme
VGSQEPASAAAPWLVSSGEHDPATVARLLRMLPEWFGIEASNAAYVESARELPTYLARHRPEQVPRGAAPAEPVGVLLARRHFPSSAEIYLLAVDPAVHRHGVGRALVTALEADLAADGVEWLQVKTLGPSHPSAEYERTRRFYAALGFRPLEEIHGLWPDNPCLIMVKVLPADKP